MGSTRLPGKSMAEITPGMSLLEMVIRRTQQSKSSTLTVLATSVDPACDPLAELAEELGCDIIRGSEEDVLSRFVQSAHKYRPDSIVRVCADNPFISPAEIDKLIVRFTGHSFDYASNAGAESGLPDGFGAEIIKAEVLKDIYGKSDRLQKEHVTKYILDNPDKFKILAMKAAPNLYVSEISLDIDCPEDLKNIQRICGRLDKASCPFWDSEEILSHV